MIYGSLELLNHSHTQSHRYTHTYIHSNTHTHTHTHTHMHIYTRWCETESDTDLAAIKRIALPTLRAQRRSQGSTRLHPNGGPHKLNSKVTCEELEIKAAAGSTFESRGMLVITARRDSQKSTPPWVASGGIRVKACDVARAKPRNTTIRSVRMNVVDEVFASTTCHRKVVLAKTFLSSYRHLRIWDNPSL